MSIIREEKPQYILGSPLAVSVYSVKKEAPHLHHNCIELIYCVQGEVTLMPSYESFVMREGDMCLVNADEVHAALSDGNNLLVSLYIDLDHACFSEKELRYIQLKLFSHDMEESQKSAFLELNDRVFSLLYVQAACPKIDSRVYTKMAESLVELIYDRFSCFYIQMPESEELGWSKERFERILQYINRHYAEKLTLKALSEMEHLSVNYMSIYFNKIFHDTFNNYLAILRAYYSEKELLTTDRKIPEIAYNNGFSDPKLYYKTFRQLYGTTPGDHRRQKSDYCKVCGPNRVYSPEEIRRVLQPHILYHFSKQTLAGMGIELTAPRVELPE